MDSQKQEQYKKSINSWLKGQLKGIFKMDYKNNPYFLTKKGLSHEFIANVIADFMINNEEKIKDTYDNFLDYIIQETDTMYYLLENPATIEKAVQITNKFYNSIGYAFYNRYLIKSKFNLSYFIGTENTAKNEYLNHTQFRKLLNIVYNSSPEVGNERYFKKFMIYFLSNESYVEKFSQQLVEYFPLMDIIVQRFLTNKTKFFDDVDSVEIVRIIKELDNEKLIKEIIDSVNWYERNADNFALTYLQTPEEYKKFLFKTEKDFFTWYIDKMVDSQNKFNDFIYDWGNHSEYNEQFFEKLFTYVPDFFTKFSDRLDDDQLVQLKYSDYWELPKSIKEQIQLPSTEVVTLDGDDIERLVYDHDESPAVWVKYYVDEELWEHTDDWGYYEMSIEFDEINEKNLTSIKEYLKNNGVEVDEMDRDELDGAMMEDNKIESVLRRANSDTHRNGDEMELIKDIENILNELFPSGWERVNGGIKTEINLNSLDTDEIKDSHSNCGEWSVKCIWLDAISERSSRDKPSLPSYRYGINGDFDGKLFNDHIEEGLSEIT